MDSRQSPTFEGVTQQYEETGPPPPYHVVIGETGPSPQQGDSDRATSRLHPSRLEAHNAADPPYSPAPASPQNEPLEEIDYFRHGFCRLRHGIEQDPADWDRVEASVLIIHDQMARATSQLARSRRQRQADARLHIFVEEKQHTLILDGSMRRDGLQKQKLG